MKALIKIPRNWQSELLEDLPHTDVAGGGTIRSHRERAKKILGDPNYGTLFAYLWRRFGPPVHGWDDHKELVTYYLSTPLEGVAFGINCSPSGVKYGVSYCLSKEWCERISEYERGAVDRWYHALYLHCINDGWAIWNESYIRMLLDEMVSYYQNPRNSELILENASPAWKSRVLRLVKEHHDRSGRCPRSASVQELVDWRKSDEPVALADMPDCPHRTVLASIEAGVRDLLRPVNVRDVYINVHGRVPDEKVRRAVRPTKRAGCGCSPDFIDHGDSWWDLAEKIREIGVTASLAKLNAA